MAWLVAGKRLRCTEVMSEVTESKLKLVSAIFKRQMYFFVISNEVHWQEI